jgi:uncharacterized damage-inducible protein DinB
MTPEDLVLHLRYHAWASRRAMEAAGALSAEDLTRDLRASHGSVLGTLAHVFLGDRIWYSRLQGRGRTTLADEGEDLSLAALREKWPPLHDEYGRWSEGLTADDWNRVVAYATLAGTPYRTPVRHIVLHVVNHGTAHRGQVASLLRQFGRTPPALDLIEFYRSL